MNYEYRIVKDPILSTFNDLKLFEQESYCYKYIKALFPNEKDEDIIIHSEIASACFRQASEYYLAGQKVSISTSPLLYSYAMNNLLKGVCYLKSFDKSILDGFYKHGFSLRNIKLKEDILKSKTTLLKGPGAVQSLLKLFDNFLAEQDIEIFKLLRHIPGIERYYYESNRDISFVAIKQEESEDYLFEGANIDNDTKNVMRDFHIMITLVPQKGISVGCLTMKSKQQLEDKVYNYTDVFYKQYINLPEKYEEGTKSINISFYCYLLIMSYGMMVRYNPNKWEKYVDKKSSQYATLIELSIPNSILNFYFQMHYLLFGFYYKEEGYDFVEIKKIIRASTPTIMNNITTNIEQHNLQYNSKDPLPWRKNVR